MKVLLFKLDGDLNLGHSRPTESVDFFIPLSASVW